MKVPQYQESQRFGPAPDARFSVNGRALSLALGGETWAAVDRAGGRMRATGEQVGGIALELMREHNETVAMDRLNRAEAAILDMQTEQGKRLGGNALDSDDGKTVGVTGTLRAGLDTLRGELTRGLNPAQQKLFDLAFTHREQSVLNWGAGFEAQQREVFTTGTEDGRKALDGQLILAHCQDPEQVSNALGNIQYVEERRGKRLGLAPEAVEANVTRAMQKALLPMFDAMLDRGELGQARNALKLFGPDLGAGEAAKVQAGINARAEALAAQAGAARKKAAAEAEKTALRGAVDGILADVAPYPTLEEQKEAAFARADALPDAALRDTARASIARELAWRRTRRDAADVRSALEVCRTARKEGLSPRQWRERLDRADLSDGARNLALAWSGEEGAPESPESADRTMTLLRAVERGRAGGHPLTEDDVLAAALGGGLSERRTRQVLARLEDGGPVPVSRLDDVCLDVGLPPDEHGRIQAPAWLYEGVAEDLSRNGLLAEGKPSDKPLSDEILARSVTRVWRRRETALAARGPRVGNAMGAEGFASPRMGAFWQSQQIFPPPLEGEIPPPAPPSLTDSFNHGVQDSVSGLWWRGKLPDILTPRDLEGLDWAGRLALATGRTLGDSPTLLAGGLAGLLGGASAPVTVPAGALGLTEGTRAVLNNDLRSGTPQSAGEFAARMGDNLTATLKGMALGGVTGAAGAGAQAAVRAAGGGALAQTAGGLAAEAATLPTAAAGMEGRLPEARDFADAALMVLGGRAAGKAYRVGEAETRAMIWALRDMYAKQGVPPRQAAEMLLKDPSGRSEKLLEEGRRHTRLSAELRAQGKPDRVPPTDFTDYRSPEYMAMLRGRLRAVRPEEKDFLKALKSKDAASQAGAQRTADNLERDFGVQAVPVETEPGVWALRVDRVPLPPAPDTLKQQLRDMYGAMKRGEACPTLDLGVVGPEEAARIRQCTGQNVLLEKRVLRIRDMEHADIRHGGERIKGQGNLREEDFVRYAEIVLDPDWIEAGRKPGSIRYMRRYGDGTVYAVEYNKSGKRLEGRTMWRALPGAQPEIVLGLSEGGGEDEETQEDGK